MAYIIQPCRGCGGPKGGRAAKGVAYCADCRTHLDSTKKHPRQRVARPKTAKFLARQEQMILLYVAGQTLHQIGAAFGVTRERVRQIIAQAGISRKDGGGVKRAEARMRWKNTARDLRRNARTFGSHGCAYAEAVALNDGKAPWAKGSLAKAYINQKRSSQKRGIDWRFTFPEWVGVWVGSGNLGGRGRTGDSYVMARLYDQGPYSPQNVYITTLRLNGHDYQMKRLGRVTSYAQAGAA